MMDRIKIFVWTLGTISAGEISIAAKFTKELPEELYEVAFLFPNHYENVLPEHVIRFPVYPSEDKCKNRALIQKYIDEFMPDYFLVSDPYTAHFASSWSGFSFTDIKNINIPLIGLDEYNCKNIKRKKDYYAGMIVNNRDLIEECDYILQDVPVNPIEHSNSKGVWAYSLFSKEDMLISDRKQIRKEVNDYLGLHGNWKLVVLPISSWESVNMNHLPILDRFMENLIELVFFYLTQLEVNEKICLLHIGKQIVNIESSSDVIYRNIGSLNSNLYDKCIVSCDAFISFNAVSVSLSKAILSNVPSVLFINEKVIQFDKLEKAIDKLPVKYGDIVRRIHIAYPYLASTFGWYKFIKPIMGNNTYYDLVIKSPVFSYSKAKQALARALDYWKYINENGEKLQRYREELILLKTPKDIMEGIMKCEKE